jgi:hypothetical protein
VGVKYNVPAVTSIHGTYTVDRPIRGQRGARFFTYLIHGGAVNLNKNETRISIEIVSEEMNFFNSSF